MSLRIKNWKKFQHYGEKRKKSSIFPWIKLYHELLNDIEWFKLSGDSAKGLVMLWLIASEENGQLPEISVISFRLRKSEKDTNNLLSTLSHWLERDDSNPLADCYQPASNRLTEIEIEIEKRGEEKNSSELEQAQPPEPAFIIFPTNGKTKEWELSQKRLIDLKALYPGVNVELELRRALDWANREPTKRKTARGMERFLNAWLSRSQNTYSGPQKQTNPQKSVSDLLMESRP